jgi:hypothetical protein
MGKTFHTKHDARKGREGYELSRHPKGTRAKGLRKVLRTRMKVAAALFPRDRFGWAEEKSSRLRGGRRNVHKAARQQSRTEISAALDDSTQVLEKCREVLNFEEDK